MKNAPSMAPRTAFVVMCENVPCFTSLDFERAMQRLGAYMKSDLEMAGSERYRIVRVEAE